MENANEEIFSRISVSLHGWNHGHALCAGSSRGSQIRACCTGKRKTGCWGCKAEWRCGKSGQWPAIRSCKTNRGCHRHPGSRTGRECRKHREQDRADRTVELCTHRSADSWDAGNTERTFKYRRWEHGHWKCSVRLCKRDNRKDISGTGIYDQSGCYAVYDGVSGRFRGRSLSSGWSNLSDQWNRAELTVSGCRNGYALWC